MMFRKYNKKTSIKNRKPTPKITISGISSFHLYHSFPFSSFFIISDSLATSFPFLVLLPFFPFFSPCYLSLWLGFHAAVSSNHWLQFFSFRDLLVNFKNCNLSKLQRQSKLKFRETEWEITLCYNTYKEIFFTSKLKCYTNCNDNAKTQMWLTKQYKIKPE